MFEQYSSFLLMDNFFLIISKDLTVYKCRFRIHRGHCIFAKLSSHKANKDRGGKQSPQNRRIPDTIDKYKCGTGKHLFPFVRICICF